MDLGPIEERSPNDLLAVLEKALAGGRAVTLSVFGHRAVVIPTDALRYGKIVTVEVAGDEIVVLPMEAYSSILETLDVIGDPEIMASLREARAQAGDDLDLDEVRRVVAKREE
jgi:hypothetical protein